MVFLIKYNCACVGVNKLSDLSTCTVQIQSQHNYCLVRCYILGKKNYMFRPVVAIIRSLSFDTLKSTYTIVWWCVCINTLKCIEWQRPDDGYYRPKQEYLYNCIRTLKCIEWQRPDDGHYRPKQEYLYNCVNTLKCIEWQRPDDGHYRPKQE